MNLWTTLIYIIFFLSGFARIDITKVKGIQFFVILSIVAVLFLLRKSDKRLWQLEPGVQSYYKFIVWSLPALLIGVIYGNLDAIYFYVYTCLPLFLFRCLHYLHYNFRFSIFLMEISLMIVITFGWLIYFGVLPLTYLFDDITEAEFNIGYWGISYMPSSRNHDYMYPLVCAAVAIYLHKGSDNFLFKLVQLVIFYICDLTLIASLSRGGMIVAFFYLFIFIKNQSIQERWIALTIIVIAIIANLDSILFLFNTLFKDIFFSIFGAAKETHTGGQFSNEDRKDIYWNAIKHILINPIGYGIQNYKIMNDYGGGSAENAYLTVFVERGWGAGYFFIMYLWYKWKSIYKNINKRYSLNFYLLPAVSIYFLFNYEFTSFMCVMVFYLILASEYKDGTEIEADKCKCGTSML